MGKLTKNERPNKALDQDQNGLLNEHLVMWRKERERETVVEGRSHPWVLFVQAKRKKEGEEEKQVCRKD